MDDRAGTNGVRVGRRVDLYVSVVRERKQACSFELVSVQDPNGLLLMFHLQEEGKSRQTLVGGAGRRYLETSGREIFVGERSSWSYTIKLGRKR
jgi:hypothetical protein